MRRTIELILGGLALIATATVPLFAADTVTLQVADAYLDSGIQLLANRTLTDGATFQFTPATDISEGGQIMISIPSAWAMPTRDAGSWSGYVCISSASQPIENFTVTTTGYFIIVAVAHGASLPAGQSVNICYCNPWIQWNLQNNLAIPVRVRHTATADIVATDPLLVDVVAGPPAYATFDSWGLVVQTGQVSQSPVKVRLVDSAWITTKATSAVTVTLAGYAVQQDTITWMTGYIEDPTAKFSLTPDLSATIQQLTIAPGASSAEFYYRTSTTTANTVVRASVNLGNGSYGNDMWISVINGGISNAKIHKGDNSTSSTITLNVNETAYIDFNLGTSNLSWQVLISTSSDRSNPVWTYWGSGTPLPKQVTWNGWMSYYDQTLGYYRSGRAPNGKYYVRIQLGNGSIFDDSLSLTLESLEISGFVQDELGNPVAGVNASCYGPSSAYTVTDSTGHYVLSGLTPGSYNLSFQKFGYSNVWLSAVNAGTTRNVEMKQSVFVRINAHRGISTDTVNAECWGNVQLIPKDGSYTSYGGSLHFSVDVSTSDNGMWVYDQSVKRYEIDNSSGALWEAGKWTTIEVVPGNYTLRAELYGYDTVTRDIAVSVSTQIANMVFAPRTVVTGIVRLPKPAADSWGTWVSIEAVPDGSTNGMYWAGTSIPQNMSSGTYTLNGVSAGNYTLRTFAQGYRRASTTVSVPSGALLVTAPDIALSETGVLRGTVTVEGGDTTGLSVADGKYNLWVNAWSPDTYYGSSAQVYVSTNVLVSTFTIQGVEDGTYWVNSYLQGFELQDAVGYNGVRATVSGGSGTVNLKFKRYSARIQCTFKVPDDDYGNPDYANLKVSISGPNIYTNDAAMADILARNTAGYGITFDTHTGIMTTPPLTTGFFQVKGTYGPTGFVGTKSMMAVNDRTSYMGIDLTAQTCAFSGKVSISAANPPAGFSGISSLVAAATGYNTTYIDSQSTTAFRVQARDYTQAMESSSSDSATSGTGASRSGVINEDGTFTIKGLVPGVYLLTIPALELDGNYANGNETAETEKVMYLSTDTAGVTMEVSKGYIISGLVKLPAGETASRSFTLEIRKPTIHTSTRYIGQIQATLSGANTGYYEVKGLASGDYVLTVNDWGYSDMSKGGIWMPAQYANTSIYAKVESADLKGQDIQLGKGGKIVFKLRDADSGTIITPANKDRLLPSSFYITSQADPWVEGGWAYSGDSNKFGSDSSSTTFEMRFLPEASYDLKFEQSSTNAAMYSGYSGSSSAGSGATYATKLLSGIKVRTGQTTDIGTVDIKQGGTINGKITDKNGNPLPNIPVCAIPSLSNNWETTIYGYSDANGKYSIAGLNPDYPYYDFVACPRVKSRGSSSISFFYGNGGIMYGEKTRPMIKLSDHPTVDFVLDDANGSVRGKVVTDDGGKLMGIDDPNVPCATIMLQMENTVPRDNPIGDTELNSDVNGEFLVEALSPGTYRLYVLSSGYLSETRTVTVGGDTVDLGTITLRHGARVSGSITGVDGKAPPSNAVEMIVAVTDDFGEIVLGRAKTTGQNVVSGYELAGFQPGTNYNIMLFGESSEGIPALMNYSVPYSTYVKTDLNLVYRIAEPSIFSRVTRDGNRYTVYFELSDALRKSLPSDELDQTQNPNQTLVSVVSGNAAHLSYPYMSPDRKKVVCVYTAGANETSFVLRLHAFGKTVNPATGTEFEVDQQFQYFAGISARNRSKISNIKGGKITLEGDPSYIQFAAGTFEVSGSTSSVFIDFSRADSVTDLQQSAPGKSAPRLTIPRTAPSYPSRLYAAMQAAQAAGVSPFSAFYDVMLPMGVSRSLRKDATLTLQSSGTVDLSTLNVYYYDETNRVYLLENREKTVDAELKTISVKVNHASVFVILQANAASIQGTAYDGPLFIYNYPNPFSLDAKPVTLTHASAGQQNQTINGTMVHYGLPSSISGEVEMRIYTVAGELVRTINDGMRAGGNHYYTAWDGTNDAGKKVASGVYVLRFTIDKKHAKFLKMAVIK